MTDQTRIEQLEAEVSRLEQKSADLTVQYLGEAWAKDEELDLLKSTAARQAGIYYRLVGVTRDAVVLAQRNPLALMAADEIGQRLAAIEAETGGKEMEP